MGIISINKNILRKRKSIFVVIILLFFLGTVIFISYSLLKILINIAPDFYEFIKATHYFLLHINPYNTPNHQRIIIIPPVSALLYIPFIELPYNIAQGVYVLLSAISVPMCVYYSLKLIYKKFSVFHLLFYTSLAFTMFPVRFTLGMGQTNTIGLLPLLFGYYLFEKKYSIKAGFFLAIAFCIKPMLLFVILFFFLQKAWKTITTIIVTLVFFVCISILLFGTEVYVYYIRFVIPVLISSTAGREVYYNQGIMGFISRITGNPILRGNITILISVFVIFISFFVTLKRKASHNFQIAILLVLVLLIHTLAWQHQFAFLVFPFIFATKIILKKRKYILLTILCFSYLLVSSNIKNPSHFMHFPASLLLSNNFYGAIILLGMLLYILQTYKVKYKA